MNTLLILSIFTLGAHAQTLGFFTNNRIVATHLKMRMYMAKGSYYIQFSKKPAATNMLKMFHDSTLASDAQTYADSCPTAPSGGSGYGENMHYVWTTSPISPLDGYAIDAPVKWEQEFSDYGLSSLTMDATILASGARNAIQMAWAKTKYVGCGVTDCGPDPSQSNKTRIVVVCRYSPKGNNIGEDMYEAGLTCSNCPSGTACESEFGMSTGLCV